MVTWYRVVMIRIKINENFTLEVKSGDLAVGLYTGLTEEKQGTNNS